MIFERTQETHEVSFKERDKRRSCTAFDPWMGRCKVYETRFQFCKEWKCWWLNLLSYALRQPMWNNVYHGEIHG